MAHSAKAIRGTAAGVGGTASVVAFLSAIAANPYMDLEGGDVAYTAVLVVPFAIYFWLVRTRKRSIQLGVVLCSLAAWWIVFGYGPLRTTDDGLAFMYPLFAWVATLAVAVLGGLYDHIAGHPPAEVQADTSASS